MYLPFLLKRHILDQKISEAYITVIIKDNIYRLKKETV
jgi:hypothetical protein